MHQTLLSFYAVKKNMLLNQVFYKSTTNGIIEELLDIRAVQADSFDKNPRLRMCIMSASAQYVYRWGVLHRMADFSKTACEMSVKRNCVECCYFQDI